jgi:hypothetical protein
VQYAGDLFAQETLDWTIRERVRTETVVAVEKSPAPGNRHRLTFTPLPDEHAVVTKVLCLLQDLSETSNLYRGNKSVQGHAGLIGIAPRWQVRTYQSGGPECHRISSPKLVSEPFPSS